MGWDARKASVHALESLAVMVLYFTAAKIGLAVPYTYGNVSPVWPSAGIALGAILIFGPHVCLGIVAGAFLANFFTPVPHLAALAIGVGNTLGPAVAASLLHGKLVLPIQRLRDVLSVILFGSLGTAISAVIGSSALFLAGVHTAGGLPTTIVVWWFGDLMGVLLVTPLLLNLANFKLTRSRLAELGLLMASLLAASELLFRQNIIAGAVFGLLLLPFVLWGAARFSIGGATLTVLAASAFAVWETGHGVGPFLRYDASLHHVHALQIFIATLSLSGLCLGAVIAERTNAEDALAREEKLRRAEERYLNIIEQDISALRQAEQTLRKQAALIDLAHDAIMVCDLEDRISFWNRGATDTYGWSAEEALGHVAHQLLHTRFSPPLEKIEHALRVHEGWQGELEHTTKDGRTIVMASRWSLSRDESGRPAAVLQINRDITRRKRTEQQLRDLMERLSLATKIASIGIWDLDLRTYQAVWDETTFAIFDIPNVVSLKYEEFTRRVHPEDLPAVEAALQRAIQGKTQASVEFRIVRPDGSVRHVSTAQGAVLDENGDAVRLVGTLVDITERKQMEAQIEASKEQMLASARLSALGMMAGGVAHEINNPLSIIHASAADLLRKVKLEGAVPVEVALSNGERVLQTANRIAKIIKSMRHLAREGSQDKARPTPVSRILDEALEVCKERFKNHSVDLLLPNIDPALSVCCREVQIAQVLLNLLQNAFDAVTEQAGERWVCVGVEVQDDEVKFSVTDSGPGIPPQLKTKIMEPFFTTKEVGKGTGLGLSLSQTIVKNHGGKLELTAQDGHPCFSFSLPLVNKERYAAEKCVHSSRR